MTPEELFFEITKILQNFCNKDNINVDIEMGEDFGYYHKDKIIEFGFFACETSTECFMNNAINNGLKYGVSDFVLSFLHEIGHYYTYDWLTPYESKKCDKLKEGLNGDIEEDNYFYFDLLDEKLATDWAIEYVNTYPNKCLELSKTLEKIFEKADICLDE